MSAAASPAGPDVFISYAREDRALAQALAQALEAQGLDVWWDRDIPIGRDFAEVIAENLAAARVVCVLWSAPSVLSSFVRDESSRARDAGKLLPIRIGETPLPLGFGTLHTLDLLGWQGAADDPACQDVVREVRQAVAGTGTGSAAGAHAAAALLRESGSWNGRQRLAWRWRGAAALAALAVVLAALGWTGWRAYQGREARLHLGEGLRAQFAPDPNLEAARNEYLFALAADARLSPAHYYLAHVYAQLDRPADARTHFLLAIQSPAGLDSGQREEAEKLLRTLNANAEPAALPAARREVATAGPAPAPPATATPPDVPRAPVTSPGPAAAPSPPRVPAPATAARPAARPPLLAGPAPRPAAAGDTPAERLAHLRELSTRVPPTPELAREVATRVAALFSADPQERLNAATALALTPADNSEAVAPLIERALAALRRDPADANVRAGVHAGLGVLQNASAMSLAFAREPLQQLLQQAAPLSPQHAQAVDGVARRAAGAGRTLPRVFIQIAAPAQRPLAEALAQRLRAAGYDVPGIEDVGARAPARTELRVQGTSHLGLARWQRRQLAEAAGETPAIIVLRKAAPAVDTYELWLAAGLCTDPRRQPDGCSGTLR